MIISDVHEIDDLIKAIGIFNKSID